MTTKMKKPKRIPVAPKVQFTCVIEAELLERANKARRRPWPAIIKEALEREIAQAKR